MRVKYIATCEKTDSLPGSGLRWEPGQTRDVTPELGQKLLACADTWVRVGGADVDEPIDVEKKPAEAELPLPLVDFHAMDKKALTEYAQEHHGVKLDPKMNAADTRAELIRLHTEATLDEK